MSEDKNLQGNPVRKSLHFDLKGEELARHHKSGAYSVLKNFFEKEGFEHRKDSDYISIKPLSIPRVNDFIRKISRNFFWLKSALTKFDITDVPKEMGLEELIYKNIDKNIKILTKELTEQIQSYKQNKNNLSANDKMKIESEIVKSYKKLLDGDAELKKDIIDLAESLMDEQERQNAQSQRENKPESVVARKIKEFEKEVSYYEKNKDFLFPAPKKESEDKIINLCVDLVKNHGIVINEKSFETFLKILNNRQGKSL